MVLLLRCVDVRFSGLKLLRSQSWTINPYACKRLVIDGVYIYSSQKEGVWADGISGWLPGCHISNSTIETGDHAIVFSRPTIGPCSSHGERDGDQQPAFIVLERDQVLRGNSNAVRHVTISNVTITNSNRGLAFMVFDGGIVEDCWYRTSRLTPGALTGFGGAMATRFTSTSSDAAKWTARSAPLSRPLGSSATSRSRMFAHGQGHPRCKATRTVGSTGFGSTMSAVLPWSGSAI